MNQNQPQTVINGTNTMVNKVNTISDLILDLFLQF